MGSLKFDIVVNNVQDSLVLNPNELLSAYFYGIPICNSGGQELSYNLMRDKILIAQKSIEDYLGIKLNKQFIRESVNFFLQEWKSWSYVKCSYNVRKAWSLEGRYNTTTQVTYPQEWLSERTEQSSIDKDRNVLSKNVYVIPGGSPNNVQGQSAGVVYNGSAPFLFHSGSQYIPNYWLITYQTGFEKTPIEILDIIGKLAAVQLLAILGDIYMGVGMASNSISLDGLSQSTSLLKSQQGGIYAGRIAMYMNDIVGKDGNGGLLASLKSRHTGIVWDVL